MNNNQVIVAYYDYRHIDLQELKIVDLEEAKNMESELQTAIGFADKVILNNTDDLSIFLDEHFYEMGEVTPIDIVEAIDNEKWEDIRILLGLE